MKKKVLAAIVIAAALLAGCGDEEPTSSPVEEVTGLEAHDMGQISGPVETAEPEEIATTTEDGFMTGGENHPITNREIVNGQMQSYLTGEWKDANVVQRRNFAVMIPNNRLTVPGSNGATTVPQHGISKASIIYEAPVEGRITRLMAIFEDYDDLDKIGPVRSSRLYYVEEAMAYDSIYCNWGLAVPYVAPVINTDLIDNVSVKLEGIDVGADEAFGRGLNSGYSTEFTSSMNIAGYEKAVARLGYATTYDAHGRFEQAFTFADEGYIAAYENYPDATVVYPGGTESNKGGYGSYTGSNAIKFEYNEDDRLYYRYQYGLPHVDVDNNEQLAVSNVVFKVCRGEILDAHDYLSFGVTGGGDAYVFTNGKVIKGTWKRTGNFAANIFMDENGNEIVFNQGKTWICCIWDEYADNISWE